MVEGKEDLGNAIALNSSMVNAARLVGPAELAGLVIALVGEGYCFAIDGVSYFAVIASLLMMRVDAGVLARGTASMAEQIREGWAYASGFRPVRTILLLFALPSLMGIPFMVLMPIFASRVLYYGGAHTLGFLMGASGAGSLISAVTSCVGARMCARADADDPDLGRDVWRGADPVWDVADAAAVVAADDGGGVRHDAGDGGEQYG